MALSLTELKTAYKNAHQMMKQAKGDSVLRERMLWINRKRALYKLYKDNGGKLTPREILEGK